MRSHAELYWCASLILMPPIPLGFSRSKNSRIFSFYRPYQVSALCLLVKACTHAQTGTGKKTNTLISQILHKSHNYNAHHSSSVFLAVNHMNYNCFMNILRGKATCFNLRWNLPLFQGQFTWIIPQQLFLHVSFFFLKNTPAALTDNKKNKKLWEE